MNEERLYDYSKGLNAPYWIQEIKTKVDPGPVKPLKPQLKFPGTLKGHLTAQDA